MLSSFRPSLRLTSSFFNVTRTCSSKTINLKNKFRFAINDEEDTSQRVQKNNVQVKPRLDVTDDLVAMAEKYRNKTERLLNQQSYEVINKNKSELNFLKRPRKNTQRVNGEILFGVHPILIALQQDKRDFYKLYLKSTRTMDDKMTQIETLANEKSISMEHVDVNTLNQLTGNRVHQGICADVSSLQTKMYPFDSNLEIKSENQVWLLLVNIQDPMNLGALLRSSYFFGIDHVVCTKQNCCDLSPVVSKASSGALEIINISYIENVISFIKEFKNQGWNFVGTFSNQHSETTNPPAVNVNQYSMTKPAVIVLGSEGEGLNLDILNSCDIIVNIKSGRVLNPAMDSLNVSTAASVILQRLMSEK